MGNTRLVEVINREPAGSERQVVVIVNGADPITIDAARSVNLTVEGDGMFLWIGRKAKPGVLDLPEDLKAVVEREGDTAAPTGDETTYDPQAITNAILSHIELLPHAPTTDAEQTILDAINATQANLDRIDAELAANGIDPATLDQVQTGDQQGGAPINAGNPFLQDTSDTHLPAGEVALVDAITATDNPPQPILDAANAVLAQHSAIIQGAPSTEPGETSTSEAGSDAVSGSPVNPVPNLTREGLEAMGFKELREIGHSLNVKGTSKAELVRDILAAITPSEA